MPGQDSDRVVTATVLFADLAGSTAQRVTLGDDAGDELNAACNQLLRDSIATHDGRVVKDTGDGVMAVFSAASDAVGAAVAIHQAAYRHNHDVDAAHELSIRIGCSAGDVQLVGGDCRGIPVVEAARLEADATPGEIWVSDLVRSLVGSRGTSSFESLGELELKGLAAPVTAHRVPWEPLTEVPASQAEPVGASAPDAWGVPLPRRLEPARVFVGREREQAVLEGALTAVRGEGRRHALLIGGEPGIGKTALTAWIAQVAHDDGAVVLYGRCDEDLGIPYQPWTEALAHLVRHMPEGTLAAHVARAGSCSWAPRSRAGRRRECEPARRDRSRGGALPRVRRGCRPARTRASKTAPVVLALDDLHWADLPSLQLLRHVVGADVDLPLLVLATYRDTEVADEDPLAATLASLRREPGIERMAVGGLDDTGVVALLEAIAGHDLGRDGIELAEMVGRETDGNPFFAAEVLRHLAETGAIRQEDGRWVANVDVSAIGLPESVREVVGQRVRRLGHDVHRTLTLASVIGRDFDLGLLARAAERDDDDVLDLLEQAEAASVVQEVGGGSERFTFTHALFQHTLYDELSVSRRARAHRRIGELLEAECGDEPGDRIGELAYHWLSANVPAEAGKAAGYARDAGRARARRVGARRGDPLVPTSPRAARRRAPRRSYHRLDVVIGLGDAQRQAGDAGFRETLLDAAADAMRVGDTGRLVAATLANQRGGWASNTGVVDPERIAMLEQALAALDNADSHQRAALLATLASELSFGGDLARRRELAADAEAMARRLGDPAVLLRVLNVTFVPLWVPDSLDRTVAASEEAMTLADSDR